MLRWLVSHRRRRIAHARQVVQRALQHQAVGLLADEHPRGQTERVAPKVDRRIGPVTILPSHDELRQ